MSRQFFYDNQIRRFILQFVRMFSNFQVEVGAPDSNGDRDMVTIPVMYGDLSRNVAQIMREASENKVLSAPRMSCYINSLQYQRERIQEPNFIDKLHVRQRKYDENTQTYSRTQSNAVTVERHMPVPYDLRMNLDIWTTNTEMKLQLLEQILCLFNPDFEIQSTDNYVDWTSLSYVHLENVNFSSRSIPIGTEDQIDIAQIEFSMPIWLSMPANVKKMGVIHKIINSVYDGSGDLVSAVNDDNLVLGTRLGVTPGRYGAILLNGQAQLVDYGSETTSDTIDGATITNTKTNKPSWSAVLEQYGPINPGITQIRFTQASGAEVVGTVAYHPADPHILLVTVDTDTIPTNTLSAVDAIVRPSKANSTTVQKTAGRRYLIIGDIVEGIGNADNTDGPDFWKNNNGSDFVAKANDIVQWDGSSWSISFDSGTSDTHYVTNATTGIQYKWNGTQWLKSFEGEYRPKDWRIVI